MEGNNFSITYPQDLCMECDENKAIYLVQEKDVSCCQRCAKMLYGSYTLVPLMDRSSIIESVNDAKKLIFCLKPIAVMLKLKFPDESNFDSHIDSLKHKVYKIDKHLK